MEKYICDEQTIWLRDEDEAWSKVIELNCNLGRVIITDMLFGQFTQITYEGPTLVEQVKQFYAKLPACFNYWEVNYCPSSKGIVKIRMIVTLTSQQILFHCGIICVEKIHF